jgi:hypothetical protein
MALWSRPEPSGAAPAAPGEFEGRTADEALDRARRALGPSAELRCWKTRRGGVAGFFATEVFIASVNPPAGALAAASKAKSRRGSQPNADAGPDVAQDAGAPAAPSGRGRKAKGAAGPRAAAAAPDPMSPEPPAVDTSAPVADQSAEDEVPPMVTYPRPPRLRDADIADSVAALADGTTDQLSLNFDAIPTHTFDEVLAEAEATVAGVTAWSDRPGPSVQLVVPPPAEEPEAGDRPPEPAESSGESSAESSAESSTASPPPSPEGQVAPAEATADEQPPKRPVAPNDAVAKYLAAQGTPTAGTPDPGTPSVPHEGRRRPRPKSPAAPRAPRSRTSPATTAKPNDQGVSPQPIPDLFVRLQSLGVPEVLLPERDRTTLDEVARTLDGLPVAPPLPTAPGTVVALVGTAAALDRTARLLIGAAPFRHGLRPDPSTRPWVPEDRIGPDGPLDDVLQQGDPLEVAGWVARRRLDGRPSLVTVEIVPGHPLRPHDRAVIASVQPDYVLGAVEASVKRADIVRWRDDLGVVDALALWGLDGTVSPAELLGVLPIAFVDGVPGTPLAWTLSLLQRAADGGR